MKKFFAAVTVALLIISLQLSVRAEAADEWIYTDSVGAQIYIVRESVVYGVRTSFYARARVKSVDSAGDLIKQMNMEFNRDEGDWWYGIEGTRGSRRVHDDEDATEILRWLQAHRAEAHSTADPLILRLSD